MEDITLVTTPEKDPAETSTFASFWYRFKTWCKRSAWLLPLVLALVSFTTHGVNMFAYPYYETDEGVYMSQAWSVTEHQELSPYTYWYDHPPGGWFFIASWVKLLGGDYFIFGNAVNTGRVLMLLIHVITTLLVYTLTLRYSKKRWAAALAALVFTFSPVAIYFQRRVLLDNIMAMWVLISLALVSFKGAKLRHVLLAGITFGIALLTKVTSIAYGPGLLLAVYQLWERKRIAYAVPMWLLAGGFMLITWPLYAITKGELYDGGAGETVGLVDTFLFQAGRGTDVVWWDVASSFMNTFSYWYSNDPLLMTLSIVAVIGALLIAIRDREIRPLAVLVAMYWLFLIRGGLVITFYMLSFLPIFLITAGTVFARATDGISKLIKTRVLTPILVIAAFLGIAFHYGVDPDLRMWTVDESTPQMDMVRWIKDNVDPDQAIIMDMYAYAELHDPRFYNENTYPFADWYFKISKDPEILAQYNNDWKQFDYVAIDHEMIHQVSKGEHSTILAAIQNSLPAAQWIDQSTSFTDIQKMLSTNGDWAAIYEVNGSNRTRLLHSWNHYKDRFIHSYGQVIDPQQNITTSEGQSYAMLRAVWMNDAEMFKGVWAWSQDHLQFRIDDKLLSWKWKDGQGVTDSNNATDADLDIALALIFAAERFEEPKYLEDAKELLDSIWNHTVVSMNGELVLLPANQRDSGSSTGRGLRVNPSYFSPAHYQIFAQVDPSRPWMQLHEDTYDLYERMQRELGPLPPNWVVMDEDTGAFSTAQADHGPEANLYGYDAFRTVWRIALDQEWFAEERAQGILQPMGELFAEKIPLDPEADIRFASVLSLSGETRESYRSLTLGTSQLLALAAIDTDLAARMYDDYYNTSYKQIVGLDQAYWDTGQNYYEQNWVWFGIGLFNSDLPNIVHNVDYSTVSQ